MDSTNVSNVSTISSRLVDVDINNDNPNLNYLLYGIEVCNFKSYSGKHQIGPITELTGIIGPNGSGKSNLMDAVSFALVIKSNSLRAKKLANLVTTIPTQSQDDNSTYVKLCFKTRNNTRECSFKRSIDKNNASTVYHIDDEIVSKTDYVARLNELGFNFKVPLFLIFQDTINSLITKNPKDFTDILEEMSGSVSFKASYDELKANLDNKEEEFHRLTGKKKSIQESKKFIEYLFKQSNENCFLFQEIGENKIKLALLDFYKIEVEMERLEPMIAQLTLDVESKTAEIDQLRLRRDEFYREISRIESTIVTTSKELRRQELTILSKSKLEYHSTRSEVEDFEKKLKKAENNIGKLSAQVEESQKVITELKQQIELTNLEINRLESEKSDAAKGLRLSAADVDTYNKLKVVWEADKSASQLREKATERKNAVKSIESEVKVMELNRTNLKNEVTLLEEQNKERKIENLKLKIMQDNEEKARLQEALNEINDKVRNLDDKTNQDGKTLAAMKTEFQSKEQNSKLKKQYNQDKSLCEYLQRSYVGVYGRFKDLCQPTHKKYRAAFDRITSKYSNAFVVDSRKTANLILKNERSKFEKQTFLSLDLIKVPTIKEDFKTIEGLKGTCLLYNLIQCKDKSIDDAVRFVVGNTVYCETQGQALNVAYRLEKRYTAITKDGILFNTNGLISFNNIDSIRDNTSYDEVLRMEEVLNQFKKTYLEDCRKFELANLEKTQMMQKIACLETKIRHAEHQLTNLEESLKTDAIKMSQFEEKIRQSEAALNSKLSDLERAKSELAFVENELSSIEQKFFSTFLNRLNFASLKQFEMMYYNNVEEIVNSLGEVKRRLMDLQTKEKFETDKKLETKLAKWKDIFKEVNRKLVQAKRKLEEAKQKLDEDERIYESLKQEIDASQSELTTQRMDMKNCDAKLDTLVKTHTTLVQSKMDIKHTFAGLQESRHRLLKQCYLEGIPLPFKHDAAIFNQLFSHQEGMSTQEIYEHESEIKLDYDVYKVNDMIKQAGGALDKLRMEIDCNIREKEEEIQKLTLTDDDVEEKRDNISRELRKVVTDIEKAKNTMLTVKIKFNEVKLQRTKVFQTFLEKVSTNLQHFYQEIMQNSTSQSFLIAENPDEPYLGGVMFSCIVPGKIFQPISCLSGGEKTLAAFAFIFGLYSESFPAFLMMDEIDGPLDKANITKLFKFIKSKVGEVQFLFITHRSDSYSVASSLVGVYKETVADTVCSRTLAIDLRNAAV